MADPQQVCACDEHLELSDDGVLAVRSGAFGPRLTLRFTSSGQFRKAAYPWLSKVYARVQGGGGASGAAAFTSEDEASAGAGGAGGGYAEGLIDVADLADIELVTVGAGGIPTEANGGDGGTSNFGAHVVAEGGGGGDAMPVGNDNDSMGTAGVAVGPNGGRGLVGDVRVRGGDGGMGWSMGGLRFKRGGRGGNSRFGGGRMGRMSSGEGIAGRANTGEGAGGAAAIEQGDEKDGATGGSGVVILELYG